MKAVTERRVREEQRPKNAGVHQDQLRRQATRANRRRANQALRAARSYPEGVR